MKAKAHAIANKTTWLLGPYVSDISEATPHSPEDIIALLGMLPTFVSNGSKDSIKEQLESNYGFGSLNEMTGGSVDTKTLTYQYPDDPELKPIATCLINGSPIVFYPYAIVAFMNDGKWFITRMD